MLKEKFDVAYWEVYAELVDVIPLPKMSEIHDYVYEFIDYSGLWGYVAKKSDKWLMSLNSYLEGEDLLNIIAHEFCHMKHDCLNHDAEFHERCIAVMEKTKYRPYQFPKIIS